MACVLGQDYRAYDTTEKTRIFRAKGLIFTGLNTMAIAGDKSENFHHPSPFGGERLATGELRFLGSSLRDY